MTFTSKTVRRSLFAAVICVLIGVCYFKYHILYCYNFYRLEANAIAALPTSQMPEIAPLEDWKSFSSGSLDFKLPSSFIDDGKIKSDKEDDLEQDKMGKIFRHKSLLVIFCDTNFAGELEPFFTEINKALNKEQRFNWPKYMLEISEFNPSKFSWLSYPSEARWSNVLLESKALYNNDKDAACEYLFREHVDLTVVFSKTEKLASIYWQQSGGKTAGIIYVSDKEKTIDPDLIRRFCVGIKIANQ